MNKKTLLLFFILETLFINTKAADVEIQIIGSILGQSCNVNSSDLTKNINFPDIDPKVFNNVGDYTDSQIFTINLKNCTGSVNNLSYMFSGDPDEINPNLFKIKGGNNNNVSGIATGLGIEVLDNNKNILPINTKVKFNKTIATSSYDLSFYVRYKSTELNVISGDASSILYLDIYYD